MIAVKLTIDEWLACIIALEKEKPYKWQIQAIKKLDEAKKLQKPRYHPHPVIMSKPLTDKEREVIGDEYEKGEKWLRREMPVREA